MTPERWQRLKAIVGEALERPPADRGAFLDAACGDDDALRREAEALVAGADDADSDGSGGLAPPLAGWRAASADEASAFDDAPEDDLAGTRIGPYEVVRLLGQGGMGAVYEVARADGHFEQRGALKLVRRGADGPALRRRFRRERQILASLDHPGIARLVDGGLTDDGRPYLVMEYVEGVPLLAYCDDHQLPTEERLRLFVDVCEAVHYAHRNLVIHRDLKPSNILVTPEGRVRLLDFGIAKLLEEAADADAPPLTRTVLQPFTPEYAAPEQVIGERVTTATDVYGLGVVLYELLAGRRPFDLGGLTPAAVERLLATAEPRRPSTAVYAPPTRPASLDVADTPEAPTRGLTPEAIGERRGVPPERLRRRLEGDLDTIVLKALRREPERRYASADQLADDVRRHLDGQPVLARPTSLAYRAAKLLRRYRTAAAVAAVLLLLGAALSVVYTLQLRAERDRAEAALGEAESALAFLQQMIWAAGPEEGNPNTPIGVVLDSAAARIEPDLADQPGVASTIHGAVGYAYLTMGRLEAAERHTRRALALRDPAAPDSERVALLTNLALALSDAGDYQGALPHHAESVQILRTSAPDSPLLASALNAHAATLIDLGEYEQAEAMLEEAIPIYREHQPKGALPALSNLVLIHQYQGRHAEAVPRLREIVELMRAEVGPDHFQLGIALANLAGSLQQLGRRDEALTAFEDALAVLERSVGREHANYIMTQISKAEAHLVGAAFADARALVEPALEAAEETLGKEHPITAYALNVAGQVACSDGRSAAGTELLRQSYELRRVLYPEGHWLTANSASFLGACLVKLGRFAEAERLLIAGYEGVREGLGEDHAGTAKARARLVTLYEAWGRPEQAAAYAGVDAGG